MHPFDQFIIAIMIYTACLSATYIMNSLFNNIVVSFIRSYQRCHFRILLTQLPERESKGC